MATSPCQILYLLEQGCTATIAAGAGPLRAARPHGRCRGAVAWGPVIVGLEFAAELTLQKQNECFVTRDYL